MRFILKLRTCTIRCATYGAAINNIFSSVNDPLPVLPNFSQNGQLGLGTRYGAEIRIILKLGTCIFMCATEGTSINDFSISVRDLLPDLQNSLPNILLHAERPSTILALSVNDPFPDLPKFLRNG